MLLVSLLGWQANADHCAVRDGVMAAKSMSLHGSDAMPCHQTGGMAGQDTPEPAGDSADTLCCCAVTLASTAAVSATGLAKPEPQSWGLAAALSAPGTDLTAEPPPPRS